MEQRSDAVMQVAITMSLWLQSTTQYDEDEAFAISHSARVPHICSLSDPLWLLPLRLVYTKLTQHGAWKPRYITGKDAQRGDVPLTNPYA